MVCDGTAAQAVRGAGFREAGVHQRFAANPGWEYQISARVDLTGTGARACLGFDPKGGLDRAAGSVDWRCIGAWLGWQALSHRVVAQSDAVTFYVALRDPGSAPIYLDCIEMQAYSRPPEPARPDPDPDSPRRLGIDCFARPAEDLGPTTSVDGVSIQCLSGQTLRIVRFGLPPQQRQAPDPEPERGRCARACLRRADKPGRGDGLCPWAEAHCPHRVR